jgi:sec-independent protein translocase protein TatB
MLGLGWTEMLVVGIVALIVIGPKDLPMMMQRIGKFAGQIRRMGNEFQREINKTTGLDEVRNLRQSITEPLRKSTEEIRREFNAMTPSGPKPSGLLKPADPAKESVTDEIRAAAGMPPETTSDAAPAKKGPVKAARVKKAKPVPESTVAKSELAPVEAAPPKPAKKPAARKPAAKTAPAKSTVKAEPSTAAEKKTPAKTSAAKKPAARKPAAKRKPAKKTNESGEA